MSEFSEEKTKRKFLKLLSEYEWGYQYSVFYEDPEDSVFLLEDMIRFKQVLRRKWQNTAFLIRIQSHKNRRNGVLQAFLSILCNCKLEGVKDGFVDGLFSTQVNVMSKELSIGKQASMYRSIAKQKPHNLKMIFKEKEASIRRYTVLNKDKLIKRDMPLVNEIER